MVKLTNKGRVIESESEDDLPTFGGADDNDDVDMPSNDDADGDDDDDEDDPDEEELPDEIDELEATPSPSPSPTPSVQASDDDHDNAIAQAFDSDSLSSPPPEDVSVGSSRRNRQDATDGNGIKKIKFSLGNKGKGRASTSASVSANGGRVGRKAKGTTKAASASSHRKGKKRAEMHEFTDSDDLNGLSNSDGGSPSSHFDSDAEGSSMAPSFAGLTARQRAAQGDQSMAESLLVLPPESRGAILTEAERAAKKAEVARRRKNQSEKKLEDDKIETINRLLNAQPGRNRGKAANLNGLPNATGGGGGGGEDQGSSSNLSPSKRSPSPPPAPPTRFRSVQSIRNGSFSITLSAPDEERYLVRLAPPLPSTHGSGSRSRQQLQAGKEMEGGRGTGVCAVEGCESKRIYRCIKGRGGFESGACGLAHFKMLEEDQGMYA